MIKVKNLVRRFGSFTAVDDISFSLEQGEVVGFLGPNGAGKTTTMRMLTGFLPATGGSVEVAGFDVLTQSMDVRRRLGYLPEGVPLYREHRVIEMLTFQGRLHGLGSRQIQRRADEVLERVGMLGKRRNLVGTLSKGQRQRIGLAVALLPDPEVLILDEPTSGLDPLQRIEVRQLIRDLAAERTVLLSSHILPEIEAVCPRVIVLHEGKIAAAGTPEELESSMAGESHVSLEAVVPDAEEAQRLLATLPGVDSVEFVERVGIHSCFRILGEGDLREDVGALAAARGWALRELSWHRPTLENLFTRLSMGLEPSGPLRLREPNASPTEATPAAAGPAGGLLLELPTAGTNTGLPLTPSMPLTPRTPGAPEPAPPSDQAPTLNPFAAPSAPEGQPEPGSTPPAAPGERCP